MNWSNVKALTIPQGSVSEVSINGVKVWSKNTAPTIPSSWEEAKSLFSSYLIATYKTTAANTLVKVCNPYTAKYLYVDGVQSTIEQGKTFADAGEHTCALVLKDDCTYLNEQYSNAYLTKIDASHFDASAITMMSFMCNQASKLEEITGWDNLDLSGISVDGFYIGGRPTTAAFQYCSSLKHISIPSTLPAIDSFMFNHCSSADNTEITIPASVRFMGGSHMFYNCGKDGVFKRFVVDSANAYFKAIRGCVYTIDGTRFVCAPRSPEVENSTFVIEEGVTKLGALCFNRQQTFTKLLLPDSYVLNRYCAGDVGDDVNHGNSLTLALYQYTTCNEYVVKDTNPNYITNDGCLYSKDGKELITIPWIKAGVLNIPEGCETIGRECFGFNGNTSDERWNPNLTQINIPASVTSIEEQQIVRLNKIAETYNTVLNVASGNTSYKVVDNRIQTIS